MVLTLPAHVHLAILGDDLVLLDIRADAYLCIPDGKAQLRPAADGRRLRPLDPEMVGELRRAGLVAEGEPGVARPPQVRPSRDLGAPPVTAPRPRDVLRLMGALWDLAWRYRGRAFVDILAYVEAEGAAGRRADRAAVLQLAGGFQAWAVWLPMPRKCLARSFVLLRFLQRSGLNATWVFGVSTWPFAAHCWLQIDDVALDDAWDRLAAYEPILAVG